ncbi:hypothetical protein ACO0SA_002341 [Hanseniaspora valbyensis]
MDELVELKYNRHGSTIKKRKLSQRSGSTQTEFNDIKFPIKNLTSTEIAKAGSLSTRRVSLLFKNIDDNISEFSNSKRNSLISNTSSWAYKPQQNENQAARRRSNLHNEIQRQTPAHIDQIGLLSNNEYQNINISDSRYGNPTEDNLNLSDINEQIGKNNNNREENMEKGGDGEGSFYDQYNDYQDIPEDPPSQGDLDYNRSDDRRNRDQTSNNFVVDANNDFSAFEEKEEMNKDYLDDINIQLTPPNKNRSQVTKQSLEKNGLESFVEDNRSKDSLSNINQTNGIGDDLVEINSDDTGDEWAREGEKYIQSKRYLELIKKRKLNFKDPVDQVDDPGDEEFDVNKNEQYEKDLANRRSKGGIFSGYESVKHLKEDGLWNETDELIRENNGLSSDSGYDSSNVLSESDIDDEDFELSESEKTPVTTQRKLRKSTRIKVPTLDFWRNEKIIYKKDPNGPGLTIDGVVKIDKKDDLHEEDFIKRRKNQSKTFTVDQGKKKRGRKKKIATGLGTSNKVNYRIYEKIDAGEIPGSDWLKFGIFETEVKDENNNTRDIVLAFAPDTASETVPTLTNSDDFTVCYTLEKKISEFDIIKTGFFKLPIETGKKSKKKNSCKWLQFIVLNGVVEVKISNEETEIGKEEIMVCVKNSEFLIPTDSCYSLENIGEDELQLNFTMIHDQRKLSDLTEKEVSLTNNESNEISDDEEQKELSKFLDGDGEEISEYSKEENLDEKEESKPLFIESSDLVPPNEE